MAVVAQALPVVSSMALGSGYFSVIYLPLLAADRGASPAAALLMSTLLYAGGATLVDCEPAPLILSSAVNLACAAALLVPQLDGEPSADMSSGEDELASFDRRLRDAIMSRRQ